MLSNLKLSSPTRQAYPPIPHAFSPSVKCGPTLRHGDDNLELINISYSCVSFRLCVEALATAAANNTSSQ
jgi:hypothetical protein